MSVVGRGVVEGHLPAEEVGRIARDGLARLPLDGRRVLVLIPDGTRTMPMPLMFDVLERELAGRVAALEILVATPAIRNLIRDDKIHQIYGSMQTGQEKFGMQTANQSLATLYLKRQISLETALSASSLKDELQEMINRGAGVVPGAGLGQRPGVARPPAVAKS